MSEIIYAEEGYAIMGACFQVYKTMDCGFLEPVYQECLEIEFQKREIPFVAQQELTLIYQGIKLKHRYKADFVCYEKIIVEIKAVENLADEHCAQVLNYLNATKFRLGLLVNFGHQPKLESRRLVI